MKSRDIKKAIELRDEYLATHRAYERTLTYPPYKGYFLIDGLQFELDHATAQSIINKRLDKISKECEAIGLSISE